jgi:transcriptional regulator with XRE-family HTH domain
LDNYRKLVGQKIRQRRKELGFKTQADLADKIGVDSSRVSRWETGDDFPTDYRAELLTHLKVSEEYLFGEKPAAPPPPDSNSIFEYVKNLEAENKVLKSSALPSDLSLIKRKLINKILDLSDDDASVIDAGGILDGGFSTINEGEVSPGRDRRR